MMWGLIHSVALQGLGRKTISVHGSLHPLQAGGLWEWGNRRPGSRHSQLLFSGRSPLEGCKTRRCAVSPLCGLLLAVSLPPSAAEVGTAGCAGGAGAGCPSKVGLREETRGSGPQAMTGHRLTASWWGELFSGAAPSPGSRACSCPSSSCQM